MQRDVRGHVEISPDRVQRAGLRHVPGHAVEDVPAAALLRPDDGFADHVQHYFVRHQFAALETFPSGTAELRLPRHVIAKQFTGRDVRNIEVCGYDRTLRSFPGSGRRNQQDAHNAILLLKPV